jgi:hypothetical protein
MALVLYTQTGIRAKLHRIIWNGDKWTGSADEVGQKIRTLACNFNLGKSQIENYWSFLSYIDLDQTLKHMKTLRIDAARRAIRNSDRGSEGG